MEERVRRVMFAMGDRDRVMTGRIKPSAVVPLAGSRPNFREKIRSRKEPMIKLGMETQAVENTMMHLSRTELRFSAATAPMTIPQAAAMQAADRPSFTETLRPRSMMSLTVWPRCFREGPKSSLVTISDS